MADDNPYDKASRYAAKLDAGAFLAWLLGLGLAFRTWLDARTLSFPGEPDRTCDTVAHLTESSGQPWAVPVEFQLAPHPAQFGRMLGYLGALWLEKRPDPEPGSRFHVGAVVINLTGRGGASRDLKVGTGKRRLRTCLEIVEVNMATVSAKSVLRAISARRTGRCLLPWIALMHGGDESAIIRRWLKLAQAEPDSRLRADYGALALVFAEAAGRQEIWKQALEGWEMVESKQVLEWEAAGAVKARRADVRRLLEIRFGPLPEALLQRLQALSDMNRLEALFDQAVSLVSLQDLQLE